MKNSVSSRSEELWNHRACLNSCWTMNLNAAKPPRACLNSCWTMILNPEKPAKMAKKPRKSKEERVGSVYHDSCSQDSTWRAVRAENLPKRSYQTRTKNPDLPALQTRQPSQAKMEVENHPRCAMHAPRDALFYVLRTGCQWRQLPETFPPFLIPRRT